MGFWFWRLTLADTAIATGSYKTTEFLAYIVVLVGIFIASAVVDAKGPGGFPLTEAWRLATFLTIGYMISRGLAKAGSREVIAKAARS
jgi:hypothetical protein